jgi:fatty-acyl-CoA synthase
MQDEGCVRIVGRLKDMIIRGGENIYPREIEEFLYTHPKIGDVQVIGVPDDRYGEEVCAWIRLRQGERATGEEIRQYCRGRIATCKIPRYIRFTDEFPTTVTGKVQKFRMREISVEELAVGARNERAAAAVPAAEPRSGRGIDPGINSGDAPEVNMARIAIRYCSY